MSTVKHQHAEVQYGHITKEAALSEKVPIWSSCRFLLALVGFYCFFVIYMVRFNLSVAIVCMVAPPNVTSVTQDNSSMSAECQLANLSDKAAVVGTFPWSKALQGNILGSFFYGYIVTQIPGGILSQRFGSKVVMMVSLVASLVSTVFVPVAASYQPGTVGPYLLIGLRVLLGMASGLCFPAMHGLWGKWAPTYERTKLAVLTYTGTTVGVVITMPLTGVLCVDGFAGGWPSIFYVSAMFNAVGIGLWWFFVYDSPSDHPRITKSERDFIIQSIGDTVQKKSAKAPWTSILTSPAVYAIIFVHFCSGWGLYSVTTSIPMYMNEVLKYDIKSNGFLSALPFISFSVCGLSAAFCADLLRTKANLSTRTVRKLLQCTGFVVAAMFVIGTGFVTCDIRASAVVCLTMTFAFMSFSRAGYMVNHVDLAPRFSAVLYGLTNTIANFSGVLAPMTVGYLTPNGTREEWQSIFYIMAAIYVAGALVFGIFARGEKQSWAQGENFGVAVEMRSHAEGNGSYNAVDTDIS